MNKGYELLRDADKELEHINKKRILAKAIIRWSREMQLSIIILVYKVECICSNEYRKDRLVFYDRYASLSNENLAKKIWKESEYWQGSNNLPI